MRTYTITLTIIGENLLAGPASTKMGTMYDNLMHELVFDRPEDFADWDLILQFRGGIIPYAPVKLGTGNRYLVPNMLMLCERLDLQASFCRGESILHANWIRFEIRSASGCAAIAFSPVQLPFDGVPEGGGAVGETQPVTVNGIGQVEGNISLTAADLPYGGTTAASLLDEITARLEAFSGATYTGQDIRARLPQDWIQRIELSGQTAQAAVPTPSNPAALGETPAAVTVGDTVYKLDGVALYGPAAGKGSARDLWNTESGAVTRHWGCRVFDGTETFVKSGLTTFDRFIYTVGNAVSSDDSKKPICTHFAGTWSMNASPDVVFTDATDGGRVIFNTALSNGWTSVALFKAWLAALYAQGKPLVAVWPLASASSEAHSPVALKNDAGEVSVSAGGQMVLTTARMVTSKELAS